MSYLCGRDPIKFTVHFGLFHGYGIFKLSVSEFQIFTSEMSQCYNRGGPDPKEGCGDGCKAIVGGSQNCHPYFCVACDRGTAFRVGKPEGSGQCRHEGHMVWEVIIIFWGVSRASLMGG